MATQVPWWSIVAMVSSLGFLWMGSDTMAWLSLLASAVGAGASWVSVVGYRSQLVDIDTRQLNLDEAKVAAFTKMEAAVMAYALSDDGPEQEEVH